MSTCATLAPVTRRQPIRFDRRVSVGARWCSSLIFQKDFFPPFLRSNLQITPGLLHSARHVRWQDIAGPCLLNFAAAWDLPRLAAPSLQSIGLRWSLG